jgi:predicted GNAT family acetyltransferase
MASERPGVSLAGDRFVVTAMPDKGFLSFEVAGGVLDMQHTFVDGSLRGQGIAGLLCTFGFEHCRAEKLQVRPSCSYISGNFLAKHPEYNDMVVE